MKLQATNCTYVFIIVRYVSDIGKQVFIMVKNVQKSAYVIKLIRELSIPTATHSNYSTIKWSNEEWKASNTTTQTDDQTSHNKFIVIENLSFIFIFVYKNV